MAKVIIVNAPGPQGPKGDKGDIGPPGTGTVDSSSFVSTSSFYAFTQSYYSDSASFANAINNVTFDTSSLVSTSSFNQFTSSYNTGSFSGSFVGTATTASYAIFSPYTITIGSRIYTDDVSITAGSKGYKHIGFNSNITKVVTLANTNGNITLELRRNGLLLGSASLANQSSSIDTTLTGWTKILNTNDLVEFYVSQSSVYITDFSIFIDIQARQ